MINPPLPIDFILDKFVVDLENGLCFWKNPTKYHPRMEGKLAGTAIHSRGNKFYWRISLCGRSYARSQIILAVSTGVWPTEIVDHIDGNSLNDRPENLRCASRLQNSWNIKKRPKKSALPMGIRTTPCGNFVARITCDRKKIHIGTYCTIEEASEAYIAARKRYFGEFCGL